MSRAGQAVSYHQGALRGWVLFPLLKEAEGRQYWKCSRLGGPWAGRLDFEGLPPGGLGMAMGTLHSTWAHYRLPPIPVLTCHFIS